MSRLCFLLLVLALPGLAAAQTACTFTSTPGMAFGAYDDSSPMAASTATNVGVRCTRTGGPQNIDVTLRLGASAGSGTIAARQMRSGGNSMNYNLYRDAARTLVWGQTAGADTGTVPIAIPNNGSQNATFTIYGSIPALQNVPAGTYTDSVQMTLSP